MLLATTDESDVVEAALREHTRVLPERRGCRQQSGVAAMAHSSPACSPCSDLRQVQSMQNLAAGAAKDGASVRQHFSTQQRPVTHLHSGVVQLLCMQGTQLLQAFLVRLPLLPQRVLDAVGHVTGQVVHLGLQCQQAGSCGSECHCLTGGAPWPG